MHSYNFIFVKNFFYCNCIKTSIFIWLFVEHLTVANEFFLPAYRSAPMLSKWNNPAQPGLSQTKRDFLLFSSTNCFNFSTWAASILLLKALQLRGCFGLLNEFFPFGPVSDAVLPVGYSQVCYITFHIILPPIFRSS